MRSARVRVPAWCRLPFKAHPSLYPRLCGHAWLALSPDNSTQIDGRGEVSPRPPSVGRAVAPPTLRCRPKQAVSRFSQAVGSVAAALCSSRCQRLGDLKLPPFLSFPGASAHLPSSQQVDPYIMYGYPSLKSVKDLVYKRGHAKVGKQRVPITDNEMIEVGLGEKTKGAVICIEDLVHQIHTVGPYFKVRPSSLHSAFWPPTHLSIHTPVPLPHPQIPTSSALRSGSQKPHRWSLIQGAGTSHLSFPLFPRGRHPPSSPLSAHALSHGPHPTHTLYAEQQVALPTLSLTTLPTRRSAPSSCGPSR
jgi:hypothetical protein